MSEAHDIFAELEREFKTDSWQQMLTRNDDQWAAALERGGDAARKHYAQEVEEMKRDLSVFQVDITDPEVAHALAAIVSMMNARGLFHQQNCAIDHGGPEMTFGIECVQVASWVMAVIREEFGRGEG